MPFGPYENFAECVADNQDKDDPNAFCGWLQDQLKGGPMNPVELTGPIVEKHEHKRIVYAPVLVPDEPDTDGDVVRAEKIEEVAHLWLEKYQNMDLQHTLNNVASPVESYIAPVDLQFPGGVVPKGSWLLAARVPESLWSQVLDGSLGGFSLMAVKADQAATVLKDETSLTAAWKRTTLADLGDEWIVPYVSLVTNPAVPAAKWVAMKSAQREGGDASVHQHDEPEPGLIDRFYQFLDGGASAKAGRRFSETTYQQLKTAAEALAALVTEAEKERTTKSMEGSDDMNEDQVKELVQASIAESLTPEALGPAIKAAMDAMQPEEPEAPEAEDDDEEPNEPEPVPELTAVKAQLETAEGEIATLKQGIETLLERIPASTPRAIKGQDNEGQPAVAPYEPKVQRDFNGRPVAN